MMARLSPLARDAAGTATIELALVAPILGAMLIGLVDISTAYSNKLRLEQVAHRTIEKVQQSGFTTSMEAALETEAETAAGAGSDADVTHWTECTAANGTKTTSTYTAACPGGQTFARYVQLDIQKTHTPIILAKFEGGNANGTVTVHGIAGIRTQ